MSVTSRFTTDNLPVVKKGRPMKYPWDTLKVGEGFTTDRPYKSMCNHAYHAGKRYGVKFACEPHNGGTRVVRVKRVVRAK